MGALAPLNTLNCTEIVKLLLGTKHRRLGPLRRDSGAHQLESTCQWCGRGANMVSFFAARFFLHYFRATLTTFLGFLKEKKSLNVYPKSARFSAILGSPVYGSGRVYGNCNVYRVRRGVEGVRVKTCVSSEWVSAMLLRNYT